MSKAKSVILTGAAGGVGMAALQKLADAEYIVYAGAIKTMRESSKLPPIRCISGWDSKILISMTRYLPERFMDWVSSKLV